MPKKYQSAKLEIRSDVSRPYYFVRATVVILDRDGRRKRRRKEHKIGFVDELSRKRAEELRAQVLETVNQGRFVAQAQIRFEDLAKRYIAVRLPQVGIATRAQYASQITNHLVPAFGDLKLCDIDRLAVEQLMAAKEETLNWWSRKNLRSILNAMFAAAKEWRLWDGDCPSTGVRIGKKKFAREKRLLKVEDMRRLLAALPERLKFLVLILFGLGLRISEALGLRWRDVDLEAGTVEIRRRWYRGDLSDDETKTETSSATLRLSASLAQELKLRHPGIHKRDQFLFLGDDGLMPPDDRDLLRFEFRPILVKLGLYYPGFGWHAFRRQNITWKQQIGGATLAEAQKGARHASLDLTYLYTLTDHEREVQQQQRMFDELMGDGGYKA